MCKYLIAIPLLFICAAGASFHVTKDGPDTTMAQVIALCSDSDTIVVHVPIRENLTIYNLTLTITNSSQDSLIPWRA